jgi:hypothetical protein
MCSPANIISVIKALKLIWAEDVAGMEMKNAYKNLIGNSVGSTMAWS